METYLVTGGAGFIGHNLVDKLLSQNHNVRILDNFSTGKRANIERVIKNHSLVPERDYLFVSSNELRVRRGVHPVAEGHAALPANDGVFANQAVAPNANAAVRQAAKVVHMQYRAVHHQGVRANLHAVGAGMDVHAFVQVTARSQANVTGKPQAHVALYGRPALHPQHEAVEHGAQAHAQQGGRPACQGLQALFEQVAPRRGRLPRQVEPRLRQPARCGPGTRRAPPFRHACGQLSAGSKPRWRQVAKAGARPNRAT